MTLVCQEIPEAPATPDYRASLALMAPQAQQVLKEHKVPKESKALPVQPALRGLPVPLIR